MIRLELAVVHVAGHPADIVVGPLDVDRRLANINGNPPPSQPSHDPTSAQTSANALPLKRAKAHDGTASSINRQERGSQKQEHK